MLGNARDERVVSQFDNREKSKVSMGTLLRFSQAKIESGTKGDLPFDEISTAKEYFLMWKRKKLFKNNSFIFGAVTFFTLIFSFTSKIEYEISMIFMFVSWVMFSFLELDKRKIIYIREMIGDMSNLSLKDRDFYLIGLRLELWNVEEEKFKLKSFLITLILTLFSLSVMELMEEQQLKAVAFLVSLVSIMTYFGGGASTIKHRRRE